MVDAPRDRVHALRRQAEQLDRAPADELARHDHRVCVAGGTLVRPGPPQALGPREELRVVEVLKVVNRHGRRQIERRERDREGIVDRIEAGNLYDAETGYAAAISSDDDSFAGQAPMQPSVNAGPSSPVAGTPVGLLLNPGL